MLQGTKFKVESMHFTSLHLVLRFARKVSILTKKNSDCNDDENLQLQRLLLTE